MLVMLVMVLIRKRCVCRPTRRGEPQPRVAMMPERTLPFTTSHQRLPMKARTDEDSSIDGLLELVHTAGHNHV